MSTAESRYSARPDALANDLSGIRPVNAAFLKARQRLLIDGAWVDAACGPPDARSRVRTGRA